MCLGVVASDGQKMPPYFFKPKEKVDTAAYYKVLRYTVLPWLKSTYPPATTHGPRMVHRATPPRKSRISVVPTWPILAHRHVAKFESEFKPLDFSVWSVLESHACKTSHAHLTSLQQAIVEAWDNLTEEYIKKSCASVRRRVEAVIANNGGHIE
ncbi:Uncharacterized protein FKW44_009437 [Caligus rogercresseyi]|uniref:Uncharacterized protein n=1 Tax=Caligus rogercresseyi TaxID=217165 RepID=A0A7T8HFA7_CALRO|nr:Uncharacterized protein FKW44_009437 [Caligus rogercresseyi]